MAGVPLMFGFIAKEADFEVFVEQGTGADDRARRARPRIGAHGGLQHPLPGRRRRSPRRRGTVGVRRAGHRRPRTARHRLPRARPPCSPRPAWSSASCPAWSTASSAPPPTRSTGPSVPSTWRCGTGSTSSWRCRPWRWPVASSCSSPADRVGAVLATGEHLPTAAGGYVATLRGLNATANRVTAVSQPGSLPVYLAVILLTAALVPGVLLLGGTWWPGWPDAVDVPGARAHRRHADRAGPRRGDRPPALLRRAVPRAWSATRWPGCSSSRARPTWR